MKKLVFMFVEVVDSAADSVAVADTVAADSVK